MHTPSRPFISLVNVVSKQLIFGWSPIALECPDIHYKINASNCGNCPTTTNHTTVTCTNVPTNGNTCTFAVQTIVCRNIFGNISEPVAVLLNDVNSRQADCTVAIVSASLLTGILVISTITFVTVLTLLRFTKGSCKAKTEPEHKRQIANYEDISQQIPSTVTINTRKNIAYGQVHVSNASTS